MEMEGNYRSSSVHPITRTGNVRRHASRLVICLQELNIVRPAPELRRNEANFLQIPSVGCVFSVHVRELSNRETVWKQTSLCSQIVRITDRFHTAVLTEKALLNLQRNVLLAVREIRHKLVVVPGHMLLFTMII